MADNNQFAPLGGRHLSRRQYQVAVLLGHGLSAKQIGARLGLSAYTVKQHIKAARLTAGAANTAQLAALVAVAKEKQTVYATILERVRSSLWARAQGRNEGGDEEIMRLVTMIVAREAHAARPK